MKRVPYRGYRIRYEPTPKRTEKVIIYSTQACRFLQKVVGLWGDVLPRGD